MTSENYLKAALKTWKTEDPGRQHYQMVTCLDTGILYQMALTGGMEMASEEAVEHLSLCPRCLSEWAQWRRAESVLEEIDEETSEVPTGDNATMMACGMLLAAASEGPAGPVNLKSPCGRFLLGVFPQGNDPEQGMVTLEVTADDPAILEGRKAIVRDKSGQIILEGTLHAGRLARRISHLSAIDLAFWTVIVEERAGK